MGRQHATANSRAFRSVSRPRSRRRASIACGSVLVSHSRSSTTSLLGAEQVDAPAAAVVGARIAEVGKQFGVGPRLFKSVRQDAEALWVEVARGEQAVLVGVLGQPPHDAVVPG